MQLYHKMALAKNLHEQKKHFVNQNLMKRKNKFNDCQNLRFNVAYFPFQLFFFFFFFFSTVLIVQFYYKMALVKNLHEQETNSMNIYCAQRGCGTQIKGLHTFSAVFIHKMTLKK